MNKLLISVVAIALLAGCSSKTDGTKPNTKVGNQEQTAKNESTQTENSTTVENQGQTAANTDGGNQEQAVNNESTQTDPKSQYPYPHSKPIGENSLTIITPDGDTSDKSIPVLHVRKSKEQLGLDFWGFDATELTFIYVDKVFTTIGTPGYRGHSSLELDGDQLKSGIHVVTAAEFTNNDPKYGKLINFVEAKYKVK
jgi:hypothetical protein